MLPFRSWQRGSLERVGGTSVEMRRTNLKTGTTEFQRSDREVDVTMLGLKEVSSDFYKGIPGVPQSSESVNYPHLDGGRPQLYTASGTVGEA